MMRDLSALGFLEYRQIVNRIRDTARQPGRALVYVLVIAYFIFMGIMRSHGHVAAFPMRTVPEPYATALMLAYVSLLGIVCYGAASGIAGAFSSAADARFLTRSLIPERTVVLWLQLRRSVRSVGRMLFSIVLYTLIFSRSGTFAGIALAIAGGTLVATAAAIPMLKLRAVSGQRFAQTLGAAIATAGILPLTIMLSSLAQPGMEPAARIIERSGLGTAFNALFNGNVLALVALYVFAFAIGALAFAVGTGLYPDLYAASMRVLNFQEKQRRGGAAAFSMEHSYERRRNRGGGIFVDRLRGPWTIAWKEWIAFARSPSMQRIFVLGLIGCAAGGAICGAIASRSHDPLGETIALGTSAINVVIILVAMGSAIGLGNDLRKPLWWMGPDPLWMRLFAWIAGTSWRLTVCLAVGLAAWSIAIHLPVVALAGIPIAIAAVFYLRAVGLALYALFPATIDQRGPLAIVRALVTYAFAAPPLVAGIVVGVIFKSVGGGVFCGIALSVVEALALIAFASARISGRGVAFAQAESL